MRYSRLGPLGPIARPICAAISATGAGPTKLGLCGGALGVFLGWLGAQGAVGGVTKTMNALYGATSEQQAALSAGEACVTIALADGLVLARSALHHSMNYRSVVIYGRFEAVTEPAYKLASLRAFIDGLYPGRWDTLRPINDKELNATTVLRIALDEASAKVRDWGVKDDEEDLEWPVWAGVIPLRTETGAPEIEHDSVGRVVPPTRFG